MSGTTQVAKVAKTKAERLQVALEMAANLNSRTNSVWSVRATNGGYVIRERTGENGSLKTTGEGN